MSQDVPHSCTVHKIRVTLNSYAFKCVIIKLVVQYCSHCWIFVNAFATMWILRSKLGFRILFSLSYKFLKFGTEWMTPNLTAEVYVGANVSCGLQQSTITKTFHTSESKWLWLKRTAVCVFLSGEALQDADPRPGRRCRRLGIFWRVPFSSVCIRDRQCKLQMNQPEGLSVIPNRQTEPEGQRNTCLMRLSLTHTYVDTLTWLVLLLILGFNNFAMLLCSICSPDMKVSKSMCLAGERCDVTLLRQWMYIFHLGDDKTRISQ